MCYANKSEYNHKIIMKILSKGRSECHFSDVNEILWHLGGLIHEVYVLFKEVKLYNNQLKTVELLFTPIHSSGSYCLCHRYVK